MPTTLPSFTEVTPFAAMSRSYIASRSAISEASKMNAQPVIFL